MQAADLACRAGAEAVVLVPCCGPPGAAEEAGLAKKIDGETCLQAELDKLGLLLLCRAKLNEAGYRTETFPVLLPSWRTREIGLAAYLGSA